MQEWLSAQRIAQGRKNRLNLRMSNITEEFKRQMHTLNPGPANISLRFFQRRLYFRYFFAYCWGQSNRDEGANQEGNLGKMQN